MGDELAGEFEAHRGRLRAVAYRMLGSLADAEDAVQETWLRLARADATEVPNLGGWLTTVLARLCLDVLRTRGTRREEPLDVHLPDPVVEFGAPTPEDKALIADSIGLALLVVLTHSAQASGSRSCCMTCSPCRSSSARHEDHSAGGEHRAGVHRVVIAHCEALGMSRPR